jgi:hypothetical protein
MKAALGDEMVVLDGIPTRYSSRTRASRNSTGSSPGSLSCSGGRLILGISDELPPPADVGRVKRVSQLLEKLEGRR